MCNKMKMSHDNLCICNNSTHARGRADARGETGAMPPLFYGEIADDILAVAEQGKLAALAVIAFVI